MSFPFLSFFFNIIQTHACSNVYKFQPCFFVLLSRKAMNFNHKEIWVMFALLTLTGPHVVNFLIINFSQLCYGGLTKCYSPNPTMLFHIDASFTFELLRC